MLQFAEMSDDWQTVEDMKEGSVAGEVTGSAACGVEIVPPDTASQQSNNYMTTTESVDPVAQVNQEDPPPRVKLEPVGENDTVSASCRHVCNLALNQPKITNGGLPFLYENSHFANFKNVKNANV